MKLWTYHPSDVDLGTLHVIESAKGQYAVDPLRGERYREALARLHKETGTSQVLWRYVDPKHVFIRIDAFPVRRWELDVDLSNVWLVKESVWNPIREGGERWDGLFASKHEFAEDRWPVSDLSALVRFPVQGSIKCLDDN